MWNFRVSEMFQNISKLGLIHVTELNNWNFKMVVLMFNGNSHFYLSLHLSFQNFWKFEHKWYTNLGLSLMSLMKCCSKYFKMVLSLPFWNGFKMGDHWTLENIFNVLFLQGPFFQWQLISFHTLCDFAAVTTQFCLVFL